MGDKVLIRSSFHGEAVTDTTLKTNNRNRWVRGSNVQTTKKSDTLKHYIPMPCVLDYLQYFFISEGEEYSTTIKEEGRLTGLVTSCVVTAF